MLAFRMAKKKKAVKRPTASDFECHHVVVPKGKGKGKMSKTHMAMPKQGKRGGKKR